MQHFDIPFFSILMVLKLSLSATTTGSDIINFKNITTTEKLTNDSLGTDDVLSNPTSSYVTERKTVDGIDELLVPKNSFKSERNYTIVTEHLLRNTNSSAKKTVVICSPSHDNERNGTLPCLNWCRYTDNSLEECWQKSLEYHAQQASESLSNLFSALLHIDHWKRSHEGVSDQDDSSGNRTWEKSVLEEMLDKLKENSGKGELNVTVVEKIFGIILDEYQEQKHRYKGTIEEEEQRLPLPSLACPIPCDYYPKIWMTLTSVVSASLLLFVLAFLLYFFFDSKSPRNRGNKHRII